MKKIVIGRRRMHKSGISSISAIAVQLFFILEKKKKNQQNQTPKNSFKHLLHSYSVVFSGLQVVCTGKCKTDTNP